MQAARARWAPEWGVAPGANPNPNPDPSPNPNPSPSPSPNPDPSANPNPNPDPGDIRTLVLSDSVGYHSALLEHVTKVRE